MGNEPGGADTEAGLAAVFDLLSREYGWTDEQILDLTLGRLRHVVRAIQKRQVATWRREVSLVQEQTRAIVSALAGTANSKKAADGISRFAARLKFLPDEGPKKKLPSYEAVRRLFGGRHS